jgi:hypothetical protein
VLYVCDVLPLRPTLAERVARVASSWPDFESQAEEKAARKASRLPGKDAANFAASCKRVRRGELRLSQGITPMVSR